MSDSDTATDSETVPVMISGFASIALKDTVEVEPVYDDDGNLDPNETLAQLNKHEESDVLLEKMDAMSDEVLGKRLGEDIEVMHTEVHA